jgi:hypothetical protein
MTTLRLVTGSLFALYLSIWTLDWTGGRWPAHLAALDLSIGLLVVLIAWRGRLRLALAPAALSGVHWIVQARLIPPPTSLVEWGAAAVGLGFTCLIAALAMSCWLRNQGSVVHSTQRVVAREDCSAPSSARPL